MTDQSALIFLLRGINLGAHNRMSMAQLSECAEAAKIADPRTVQQTGNLVGSVAAGTDPHLAAQTLTDVIHEKLGLTVPVIALRPDELCDALKDQPFTTFTPKLMHLIFLERQPTPAQIAAILALPVAPDETRAGTRVIYARYAEASHNSKLTLAKVERILEMKATARNIITSRAVLELATGR